MDNRVLYGILTLLLNAYGVPAFMQGYTKTGILAIVFGVVSCGIVAIINEIKGIIMGIKILTMTDEEFAAADKTTFLTLIPAPKADDAE